MVAEGVDEVGEADDEEEHAGKSGDEAEGGAVAEHEHQTGDE